MAIKKSGGFVTVQQHIMGGQAHYPTASGEFSWLLSAITLSTKIIASYVRRAGLVDIGGYTEDTNVQGEIQHRLDVIANDTLKRTLGYRGSVGVIASEEDDEPRVLLEAEKGGKYIVMFDPLDGSSNIDTCVPVGTIFTVLRNPPEIASTEKSVLQPGTEQIAAGYVLYGSSTVLVLTTGHGVNIFTLDPQFGAFLLVREDVMMPHHTKQYSINEAYAHTFPPGYRTYLDHAKDQGFSSRYIGSLVADFHRILIKGGVFLYPPTQANPDGKLRLMYEANPLAFIAEQAGGIATSGTSRVLDAVPNNVHCRTPLIIGSKGNVEEVLRFAHADVAPSK
jgi:fructose-1,6-bisphosphatase I